MNDGEGVVDHDSLRDAVRSSARTFMCQHARELEAGAATERRAVAKLGTKLRIIVERPLLTPTIRVNRFEPSKVLVNDLKSAPAGR